MNKPNLTPKLRFPEFRDAPGWDAAYGDELFDQINNRQAPPGLPILAITQEHGAIPRNAIDYNVSVTEKSVEIYKEVCPGDFISRYPFNPALFPAAPSSQPSASITEVSA